MDDDESMTSISNLGKEISNESNCDRGPIVPENLVFINFIHIGGIWMIEQVDLFYSKSAWVSVQ